MKYRLRYRIRDFLFRLLFPTIAMHEAHLVDDAISMASRLREFEGNIKESVFETNIITGSNCKTTWG